MPTTTTRYHPQRRFIAPGYAGSPGGEPVACNEPNAANKVIVHLEYEVASQTTVRKQVERARLAAVTRRDV